MDFPESVTAGETVYRRDRVPDKPDWIVYAVEKPDGEVVRWRAKLDPKRGRPFFVALDDKAKKGWNLPDVIGNAAATGSVSFAPSDTDGTSQSDFGSHRHPGEKPRARRGSEIGADFRQPAVFELCAEENSRRERLCDTALRGLAELHMAHTAARDSIAVAIAGRNAQELHQEVSTERDERSAIVLAERSCRMLLRRLHEKEFLSIYDRLAITAAETEERRSLCTSQEDSRRRLLASVTAELDGLLAQEAFLPGPWGRAKRVRHSLIQEELAARRVIEKSEAASFAYIVGRHARDLIFLVDRDGLDHTTAKCELISDVHASAALTNTLANELITTAAVTMSALYADFAFTITGIYQDFIRALWGKPTYFLHPELAVYRSRQFETKFAPRLGAPSSGHHSQHKISPRTADTILTVPAERRASCAEADRHRHAMSAFARRSARAAPRSLCTPRTAPSTHTTVGSAPTVSSVCSVDACGGVDRGWDPSSAVGVVVTRDCLTAHATSSETSRVSTKHGARAGVVAASVKLEFDGLATVGVCTRNGEHMFALRSDGFLNVAGAESVPFGMGFSAGDSVSLTLNLLDFTLCFGVNNQQQKQAFTFTPCDDPEPLFVFVSLPKSGSAALVALDRNT